MYGPITTLRRENRVVKHIPWAAFKMVDSDWTRVIDARDILAVGVLFWLGTSFDSFDRIPTESNSISHLKSNRRSGGHFPLLKTSNQHGRQSVKIGNMHYTQVLLTTVSRR